MSRTRPKLEQVEFRSAKTGSHLLDKYLEDAEVGNRSLPQLLADVFDPASGTVRNDLFEFRVHPETARFQVRAGQHVDPDADWTDVPNGTFFRPRGEWAPDTLYEVNDTFSFESALYLTAVEHTSSGDTPDPTATNFMFDATSAAIDALEAKITVSDAPPTGGSVGDLWFQYKPLEG
jgi:hypothetical protein